MDCFGTSCLAMTDYFRFCESCENCRISHKIAESILKSQNLSITKNAESKKI
ncbi:hypothetical protein ACWIUD_02565 [Helicobacter sp. 23-1044]